MERLKKLDFFAGWIALAAFTVFTATVAETALAATSIAGTKHNLGSGGPGSVTTSSTSEICVFCHTPHGGDTAKSAPLWNRGNSTSSYTVYDGLWGNRPSTLDSNVLDPTAGTGGSISHLCLSCHDGVTALDMLINAPGSGGYNATGLSAGYTWTGSNVMPDGITRIGTDLRNDHPIGVAYCGGRKTGSTFSAAGSVAIAPAGDCKDEDFNPTATPASGLFWVDSTVGTANVREKSDMILYVRDFGTGTTNWPSVECGSCHDPHRFDTPTFLRLDNSTGSQLCLTCHKK